MKKSADSRSTAIKLIQAVLCTAYVIFMCVQAISIFCAGTAARAADPSAPIYTAENAADAVIKGLPLLVMSVAVTVTAAVLRVKNSEKSPADPRFARDLAVSRINEPSAEMTAERARQKKLLIGGRAGFALTMIPIVLYMTNPAHFALSDREGLETVFVSMISFILPWTIIGIGILGITSVLIDKSMIRETKLAKSCENCEAPDIPVHPPQKAVTAVRCIVLAAAVTFIILGISNGGANAVLSKAITICTECIGLG